MLKPSFTLSDNPIVLFLSTGIEGTVWNSAPLSQLMVLNDSILEVIKTRGFFYLSDPAYDRNTLFLLQDAVEDAEVVKLLNETTHTALDVLAKLPTSSEEAEGDLLKASVKEANDYLYDIYCANILLGSQKGVSVNQNLMDGIYERLAGDARYDLTKNKCLKHALKNGLIMNSAPAGAGG